MQIVSPFLSCLFLCRGLIELFTYLSISQVRRNFALDVFRFDSLALNDFVELHLACVMGLSDFDIVVLLLDCMEALHLMVA